MGKFFGLGEESTKPDNTGKATKKRNTKTIGQIAVDIYEHDDGIFIVAPVAGVALEDIEIDFHEGVLKIFGERPLPLICNGLNSLNSECVWGAFERNIVLPDDLDTDSIEATMENNLLIIQIRRLQALSQNIKIDRIEI